jgi:uncharacterized membrane protein
MTHDHVESRSARFTHFLYFALLSFPVACFSLTVLTDIAYWQTGNLLWLHFSEWLLLAGLVFGVLVLLVLLVHWLMTWSRPTSRTILCGIVILLLAAINSLVHTADGWTAVVPWGLALSILTFAAMVMTAWSCLAGERHV